MAMGLGVMVVLPTWTGILIAAIIFGGGFGLYLGVDIALAVQVLPSKDARGKDLGIIYDAIYIIFWLRSGTFCFFRSCLR